MTNVTYLPWVSPEESDDSGPSEELGPQTHLSVLDIDQLEQTLLRKLHSTDMSVYEVEQWLSSHEAAEADAMNLIDKFLRLGYLDDQRLATQLVHRLHERKGKSKQAITEVLRQRGISSATITEALQTISDEEQLAHAIELAQKRANQLATCDKQTANRRLTGFLIRRGYPSSIVRQACELALSAHPRD